ncbi:MAG: hypothetical protein PUD59_03565 [bacterium]|nr:hypothetical protein [bacterium]
MKEKNKSTLIIIICVVLLVVLIMTGLIFGVKSLLESYKKDKQETNKIMTSIVNEYEKFEDKIEDYNKNLTELVTLLNESNYYDKLLKNYDRINSLLNSTTEQIEQISSFKVLNKSCGKRYVNGKADRACSSYSQTYEKCINIYVDVVKLYNTTVSKIKEYSADSSFELKEFDGYITEYIDYNSDGNFSGKNTTSTREEVLQNEQEEK